MFLCTVVNRSDEANGFGFLRPCRGVLVLKLRSAIVQLSAKVQFDQTPNRTIVIYINRRRAPNAFSPMLLKNLHKFIKTALW